MFGQLSCLHLQEVPLSQLDAQYGRCKEGNEPGLLGSRRNLHASERLGSRNADGLTCQARPSAAESEPCRRPTDLARENDGCRELDQFAGVQQETSRDCCQERLLCPCPCPQAMQNGWSPGDFCPASIVSGCKTGTGHSFPG